MSLLALLKLAVIVVFLPLIGVLLYVWHKYGKGDRYVLLAQVIFVVGIIFILVPIISI
jgi:uncharacterized membrane protein